jgi:long-chain fatty acid transport protein
MSFRGLKAVLLACSGIGVLLAATADANAGGLAVREQSAYGQGSSFAGIAAGGDLSGMFWNPAVMTQFAGIQSSTSTSAIFPYASNSPTAGNYVGPPYALGGTSNTGDAALVPSSYFSYQLNPNLWLGMSVNSPFGLSVNFPELWAGRDYAAGTSNLTSYNATPSVAYRINDWISVGAGVQIQYAKMAFEHGLTAGPVPSPPFPITAFGPVGDAYLSANGWGYGFTAGITLTPTPATTIGLGYRSEINQKFSGTLAVPALSLLSPASLTVNAPGILSLGVRQRIDPRWTLLGTVEWTNWSRIGTSVISGPPLKPAAALNLPFQYQDGWLFSVGAEYMASDRLTLRTGVGYEISPVTDQVRTPLIPDNDRFWASVGASWKIGMGLTADLAYSHLFVRSTPINISGPGNPWFATTGGITYIGSVESHVDILSIGVKYRWDNPTPAPTSKLYQK